MDFSVIAIGEVQNVLSAMQKNLECPICLDVIEEPVSTKCDHIFCRFCMFKLLSKKKKGVVQCPLCKTEVTKRSLKENSRFKQLIEGLLETIHAFELDTGVKFLNSHHFPKTSTEATAAEFLCKEGSVIQSKGFRNRKKSAKENGQENCILEANVDMQLTDTGVRRCSLRNKTQKCRSEKGIYIELGSDSSEELLKQANNTGLEDKVLQILSKEKLERLESAERENEYSRNTQPGTPGAEEIILPNVVGESDFSKESLSKKSTRSIDEHAKPGQVNVTENQSSPLNVLGVDLLTEQCDGAGSASPLRNGDTSFFKNTEGMGAEQTQCNSESKEFDLKGSSECSLDKSKEMDIIAQNVKAAEMYEPESDSLCEKELPLEKLLQPETPHCGTMNQVSRKRLKRSIQKVNEWFSKSDDILSSSSSQDDSAGATDVSGEEDPCLSDKDSCISEKTDPMVDSMAIAVVEGNKRWSKETADRIEDKIFGKTYKRGRKSNHPIILRDILPTTKKEDVAAYDKCLNNSSKDGLKRKRKSSYVLQPEDFINKKVTEEADGCPQSVNLGDAEKKRCDESSAVNESQVSENRVDSTPAELEEGGGSIWKTATEKVAGKHCDGELELSHCDQKSTKKGSAAKRCRRSARSMCVLQLVDRNSLSPDPEEPQIDSYPSSGEPRKGGSEQRQVRRSRRLRLLSEEITKTGKGAVIKGVRKYDSDHEGSSFAVQRSVLVHSSECKALCEPPGTLSYEPLTNLKGDDLERNGIQVNLKNSSDTAATGKSLFNPTSSCQHSNCCSFAPDVGSPEGEILRSPVVPQSPSVTSVQAASHPAEVVTEPCAAAPQDSGRDTQNVPGDFGTEKLPMAEKVLELTKEAEDSELDTQYLRNIFRHSKRLSFSLYPTPVKACTGEDAASATLKISCAEGAENKHSKYLKTKDLQEETTTVERLSRVCEKEKLKTHESACVNPLTCFVSNTDRMCTGEHREGVSQVASQGTLTAVRTGTAKAESNNKLHNKSQKGEQGNKDTVSADVGIECELRQNPAKSNRSQSDQSNMEENTFKRTDLNTGDEICFGSENDQGGRAKIVDSKGPILHFQSRSVICSVTCQQKPAEFSREVLLKKISRRERKGDEEQATQAGSTGMPECLATEALEEPLKGNSDFTGLSETSDGLLCSDEIEENTSFSEIDRRERSAVFVRGCDNALVKEPNNRDVSSKPRSQGIQRSRRRARKLQSSDEESSEDEDFPCFQTMLSKSVSTPLQINKQVTSVKESSVSPITSPHSGSDDDNVQEMPEAALSNRCVSPNEGSEHSVNLFSSQSNLSEESVDGAQELEKSSIQIHTCRQVSSVNEGEETSQSCNGGLKRSKTNFRDECQEDPTMGANQGEASGYDSETSYVEDSCGPFSQGEILTTQQKNAMQSNLKKLQQEMAELEAVLKQHGSQACEFLPIPSSSEGTLGMEQMRQERGAESTSEGNVEKHKCSSSKGFSANDFHVISSDSLNSKIKELERSPELLFPPSKSCLLKRPDLEKHLQCDGVLKSKASSGKIKPVQEAGQDYSHCPLEAAGKENATSTVVTNRREMSIVASGLNQSEYLVVRKFARKTQSTLYNHITEGTTHVIMKTDKELVCERTLKYFLGIAGRKWVVSYQWVIQSFKEGRILDEEDFEVRGDVINGRNHQGPKRARQSLTEKIFKDFEICCYGPFTDMTTEHLEWMVELCGASVVKQLHLFTHPTSSTAVVVVQPDAWMENTDYREIQQKDNVAMVTREWVLDSVACYECQELEAYLVS
ncbi:breast cancer type 1 susceptibility protein isoform X6 [Athene cunicularia]|uniref:breast cancer type 1 susceptibility protein isoform X6 n=1 Tax=Athene cunicularia TaxID=194338 RepID=UPI000EF6686A|nr:breast cancer type 1 susceptibility protein isoform X6 [Athene cunicularia]